MPSGSWQQVGCSAQRNTGSTGLLCWQVLHGGSGRQCIPEASDCRPRPCWLDQSVPLLIAVPNDYSFPSGHTLASVIGATILTAADRRFGLIAIPLAILIAFSRLYLYVHFPSDILGAVILGLGIGALTLCGGNWAEKWLYAHKAFEKQHL